MHGERLTSTKVAALFGKGLGDEEGIGGGVHGRGAAGLGRRGLLVRGSALLLGMALCPRGALGQSTSTDKAKIGVIGSGHIGGTVGSLWVKAGHPVMFSSRHPEALTELVSGLGSLAQAGSVEQAIAFGDALLIAVPSAPYRRSAGITARRCTARSCSMRAMPFRHATGLPSPRRLSTTALA